MLLNIINFIDNQWWWWTILAPVTFGIMICEGRKKNKILSFLSKVDPYIFNLFFILWGVSSIINIVRVIIE